MGRVNQGKKRNSGANRSLLEILEGERVQQSIQLTGMESIAADPSVCQRIFCCGFANYAYTVGEISIEKNLSVKPSNTPYDGTSAFLLTVTISNRSGKKKDFAYTEGVTAHYEEIQYQAISTDCRKVRYDYCVFYDQIKQLVGMHIKGVTDDPLLFEDRHAMSKYEGFPPTLFIKSLLEDVILSDANNEISAQYKFSLEVGEKKIIPMIVGYTFEHGVSSMEKICKEMIVESES